MSTFGGSDRSVPYHPVLGGVSDTHAALGRDAICLADVLKTHGLSLG